MFVKRLWACVTTICIIAGLTLSGCSSSKPKTVYISEVLASNNGVLADETGAYPDWIELHNPTEESVELTGWTLTDDANQPARFTFPALTLAAGEYYVLYADSADSIDLAARVIHLPFSLKSSGETVYLYDASGTLQSAVKIVDLPENISCGADAKGNTVYYRTPTPRAANSETFTPEPITPVATQSAATLFLNEYATSDTVTLADEDGDFGSWVELYNYGSAAVALGGFYLSDDLQKPDKWQFPAVSLPAGGYLVVRLSDKTKTYTEGGELHADFKLSGEEEALTLYDAAGRAVDSIPVYELTANLTYGRPVDDPAKRQFFARATPAAANTVSGFDQIESARYPQNKALVISEVAAVNRTGATAPDGQRYDYVELYNPTKEPVALGGYRLSDTAKSGGGVALPDRTLAAGGYLVVYCGADAEKTDANGVVYSTMGLNRYGETLYIFDEQGVAVDSLRSGRLDDRQSCGRISMTDASMYYFDRTMPAAVNPTVGLGAPAPTPIFSVESGYVDAGTAVSIACPGATIRYTTDGSTPTAQSTVYTAPIAVNETVTIRARAFMDGRLPSDDCSGSYIVGRRHTMPVVFLAADPDDLYSYERGILADGPGYNDTFPHTGANYWKDWERPVHVDYVDENGQAQLSFNAGVKVFGQYSRAEKQKSLSINLRDKYGVGEIAYPFFEDGATNVFSELVLRNSGQDINKAHLRDAFIAMVVKGQMDLDFMDYRPVVVYINGAYNGIYDLRDKICESYVSNRTGADETALDMIKGNSMVMSGDTQAYRALLDYVSSHDLSVDAYYREVERQVDVQELINYWIVESFFNNTDTGNIKFYRERTDDAKWRWVLFDMDWALTGSTYSWNMIEEIVNPAGHGVGKMFSTTLMCGLMRNDEFRDKFISTYVKLLRTTFATERMLQIYDDMVAELEPEMPYHIAKWGAPSSMTSWKSSCASLRTMIAGKNEQTMRHLITTCTATSGYLPRYFGLTQAEMDAYLK